MDQAAGSVLTVSVEHLSEGFLRVSFGWLIRAVVAAIGAWESQPSASVRVRRRSDDEIVYEQGYRGAYSSALAARERIEADLERLTLAGFLAEYDIPEARVAGAG